jgi:TolB-like protein
MRKILFTVIITAIFLLSNSNLSMAYEKEIKDISSTLAENIAKAGKKMIAVVDFTDLQGNVTELGRFLAAEFSVALAGGGKGFEVVDRTHLKSIIAEHKLSTTGIIDPQTARKLGQIAGVEALITGTITPFGDSIRLSAKILDTSTAKVIGASTANIAKTKAIEELLARGVETGTARETSPTSPPPPKSKVIATAELRAYDKDLTLQARECKITGQQINCTIAVVNNSRKIDTFSFSPYGTILIDESGNQYQLDKGGFLQKDGTYNNTHNSIPPDLPMIFSLMYSGVAATTKYVTVIVDAGHSGGKAVIRNIPLTR